MPMSSMDLYSIKSCKILTYIGEIAEKTPELYEEFLSHFWKQEAESGMMLSASTQIPRYSSPKMIDPMHHSMEEKIRFGSGLPGDCHTCWPLQYKESIVHHHSPAEIALRAAIRNFSTKFKSTLSAAVEVSIKSKIVNMLPCVHVAHLSNPSDISNIFHNIQQDVRVLFCDPNSKLSFAISITTF
jgi:hypothetical protein